MVPKRSAADGIVVTVNAGFLRPGAVGGAEHFARNLVLGLSAVDRVSSLTVLAPTEIRPTPEVRSLPTRESRSRFLEEALAAREANVDDQWINANYFTPPAMRLARRSITVIHDNQYRLFPQYFSPLKRAWLATAHAQTLRTAGAVVAISDFTRDQLSLAHRGRGAERIHVIPNPVDFGRFGVSKTTGEAAQLRTVLSVAAQYPHKNLETLVRAFRQVRKRADDVQLVLVGQLPTGLVSTDRNYALTDLIAELDLSESVKTTGYVSDADLGRLYRAAELFVLPSLYEGFGMPVVEALGFGLPTITTQGGALAQVGGSLPLRVNDPLDASELAECILEVLEQPRHYAPSEADRLALVNEHSSDLVARKYVGLLESLA